MSYCVYDDLVKICPERVLTQLSDDAKAGIPDQAVITEEITAEADIIDAYIGNVVKLPIIGAIPSILKRLNAPMAIYKLFIRKKTPPEHWQKQYDNCIKTLENIRDGKITLGLQPAPDSPDLEDLPGNFISNSRTTIFSSEEMDKY